MRSLPAIGTKVKVRRDLPPYLKKGQELIVEGFSNAKRSVKVKVGNYIFWLSPDELDYELVDGITGDLYGSKDDEIGQSPNLPADEEGRPIDPEYYGYSTIEELIKALGL